MKEELEKRIFDADGMYANFSYLQRCQQLTDEVKKVISKNFIADHFVLGEQALMYLQLNEGFKYHRLLDIPVHLTKTPIVKSNEIRIVSKDNTYKTIVLYNLKPFLEVGVEGGESIETYEKRTELTKEREFSGGEAQIDHFIEVLQYITSSQYKSIEDKSITFIFYGEEGSKTYDKIDKVTVEFLSSLYEDYTMDFNHPIHIKGPTVVLCYKRL